MSLDRMSCIHHGNTFFGQFEVVAEGSRRVVRVRYRDEEREETTRRRSPELVAQRLLKRLVLADVAKIKASAGGRSAAWRNQGGFRADEPGPIGSVAGQAAFSPSGEP